MTAQSHVVLRQGGDSRERVPNVPASQNCRERTWENVVKADIGEICPHAEAQLRNVDVKDDKSCCLLANRRTAKV